MERDPIEKLEEKHRRKAQGDDYHRQVAQAMQLSMARLHIHDREQELQQLQDRLAKLEAGTEAAERCRRLIEQRETNLAKLREGLKALEEEIGEE